MKTTDSIIQERGETYGNFSQGILLEATILDAIVSRHFEHHGTPMSLQNVLYFSKIAMKLSRLSITPDHMDSWTDIAGYARLVELQLKKEENA